MIPGEINILCYLEQLRSPFWNHFWEGVTFLGEDIVLIVLVALFYFIFNRALAYRLCFLTLSSLALNGIVKNLVQFPRPFSTGKITPLRPQTATGFSFPSGHTQNFATFTTVFAAYYQKKWLWLATIFGSCLMGFSRLFLGVHYPSDVLMGILLGIGIAYFGNRLLDRISDESKLYLWTLLALSPFFLYFLCTPDPFYADFFKCYGLFWGFYLSKKIEEKYGNFSENVPIWKKICRTAVGILLALLIKTGIKNLFLPTALTLSLLWDSVRYFVLMMAVFGMYPVILKKLNF